MRRAASGERRRVNAGTETVRDSVTGVTDITWRNRGPSSSSPADRTGPDRPKRDYVIVQSQATECGKAGGDEIRPHDCLYENESRMITGGKKGEKGGNCRKKRIICQWVVWTRIKNVRYECDSIGCEI